MKKVVILGCENSHADNFLGFIYNDEHYQGVEVIGVYSDEEAASKQLQEKYGVPVMNRYDEAVGQVDGVIVTARHGDNHYKYAKPYIASGVPMFIDKPITICETEAQKFMKELQAHQVAISGGSTCKHDSFVQSLKKKHLESVDGKTLGGFVRAPLNLIERYGGFFFYAQHLVEIVCEIFGRYPVSVRATKNGITYNVIFRYDGFDVTGTYVNGNGSYYAMRHSEKGIEASGIYNATATECSKQEFAEYYELLNGGKSKISYEDFIAPVFIMNAIVRSLNNGQEEIIARAIL